MGDMCWPGPGQPGPGMARSGWRHKQRATKTSQATQAQQGQHGPTALGTWVAHHTAPLTAPAQDPQATHNTPRAVARTSGTLHTTPTQLP